MQDYGLRFIHEVMGMESLHFGLWKDADRSDILKYVREAQEHYTEELLSMIPEGVKTILDVGCGVGGPCLLMHERGLQAEALSPDRYHQSQFEKTNHPCQFHLSGFEAFSPGKTYDCLYFSESPQYINKDEFFPKCLELTRPGGHLVVADFFQKGQGSLYHQCFIESDFVEKAEAAGFRQKRHRDITQETMPSMAIQHWALSMSNRFIDFLDDVASAEARIPWKIGKLFFGRKLNKVKKLLGERLIPMVKPEYYAEHVSYAMYQFTRE